MRIFPWEWTAEGGRPAFCVARKHAVILSLQEPGGAPGSEKPPTRDQWITDVRMAMVAPITPKERRVISVP